MQRSRISAGPGSVHVFLYGRPRHLLLCRGFRLWVTAASPKPLDSAVFSDPEAVAYFFGGRGLPASLRFFRHSPSSSRDRSFVPPPFAGTWGTSCFFAGGIFHLLVSHGISEVYFSLRVSMRTPGLRPWATHGLVYTHIQALDPKF